jgi:hypothetical protein
MRKCSFTRRRVRKVRAQDVLSIEEEMDGLGEGEGTKEVEVVDGL